MQFRRVSGAECGGDAALRVRGRAVEQRSFGDDENVVGLRRAPRGMQACDATSNDQEASANPISHGLGINTEIVVVGTQWTTRSSRLVQGNNDFADDAATAGSGFSLKRYHAGPF